MSVLEIFCDMAGDPFAQEAWSRDPDAYAAERALSAEQLQMLANQDAEVLTAALASGDWARCAICGDPGPDPLPD